MPLTWLHEWLIPHPWLHEWLIPHPWLHDIRWWEVGCYCTACYCATMEGNGTPHHAYQAALSRIPFPLLSLSPFPPPAPPLSRFNPPPHTHIHTHRTAPLVLNTFSPFPPPSLLCRLVPLPSNPSARSALSRRMALRSGACRRMQTCWWSRPGWECASPFIRQDAGQGRKFNLALSNH